MLRRILFLILLGAALPLAAQQPPGLEPLPEPPPPPPGVATDQPGEPQVTIEPGESGEVEEHVINGQRVVRVTTPSGSIYYLIEDLGDGPGMRNESLDSGVRVPLWVIHQF
jgi:Protein of unknown function (DUF2782)